MPHALCPKNQNMKQKQYHNKFHKDFRNGPHQKKKKYFSIKRLKSTSGKLSIPKIILPWWLKIDSILVFLIWRRVYNCCFSKSRALGPSATPVRACLCSRNPSAPWVMFFYWMAVPSFWAAHPRSEMPSRGLGALAFKPSSLKHSAFFTRLPLHLTPGGTENRTPGLWTSGPTVRWNYLSCILFGGIPRSDTLQAPSNAGF